MCSQKKKKTAPIIATKADSNNTNQLKKINKNNEKSKVLIFLPAYQNLVGV